MRASSTWNCFRSLEILYRFIPAGHVDGFPSTDESHGILRAKKHSYRLSMLRDFNLSEGRGFNMESVVAGPSNLYHITYGRQTEIAESNLNKIFTTTAASLSLIGALLIIITFIMWPDLRTNSRRMIMFISIGDFSVALFNIIGIYNPSSDNEICRMQSLVTNVAILSSFMWTLNLSFYFYLTICRKISAEYERRIMQLLHLIGWGIPILIGIIAFTMGAYGFSRNVLTPGWCWISENQKWWKVVMWMFITGKGWEIISYICIFKFYLLVILQIRREVCSRNLDL